MGMAALRRLGRGLSLLLLPWLAACVSGVEYGPVPHADYLANGGCESTAGRAASTSDAASARMTLFLVSSRLPDCRGSSPKLLHHRGDKMRYGYFAAPPQTAEAEKANAVPLRLAPSLQWWEDVNGALLQADGRVLVYVHGFKESFFSTARDTAQIKRLTGFSGPIIHYSWPSQNALLKYAADETNMYWDERNFRVFLQRLAGQSGTKEIVLVAHSLGARLVLPAIEYVDRMGKSDDSSTIANIILASPDIDSQDFERDIAEALLSANRIKAGRRITVYASAKDNALDLSRRLHGYPRLGSPYCFDTFEAKRLKDAGQPVRCYARPTGMDETEMTSALTIVDTSAASIGQSGHSDYLRSASICRDFAAVVAGNHSGSPERVAGPKSHVFLIAPATKSDEAANRAVCSRPS
jgi:esterase/lipase superfamily enzyme